MKKLVKMPDDPTMTLFEVTDTIGFGDNRGGGSFHEISELIMSLSSGQHAAFYVINIVHSRVQKQDIFMLKMIKEIFLDEFQNTYIILT